MLRWCGWKVEYLGLANYKTILVICCFFMLNVLLKKLNEYIVIVTGGSFSTSILSITRFLAGVFKLLVYLSVLQNNATFRFSSLVYGLKALLCLSGTKIHWWLANEDVFFFCLCFILVLYLYAFAVDNPEISGFCESEIIAVPIDYKWVKKTSCCSKGGFRLPQRSFLEKFC